MFGLRYAIRSLSRAKGFAATVIPTLALGSGADTAIFNVVRGVLLQPFAGDSSIVGKALRVGGKAVPVVGALQAAPAFPERMDALMNMVNSEPRVSAMMVTGRTHRMTQMIARLAPGATVGAARAEVAT